MAIDAHYASLLPLQGRDFCFRPNHSPPQQGVVDPRFLALFRLLRALAAPVLRFSLIPFLSAARSSRFAARARPRARPVGGRVAAGVARAAAAS